MQQFGFSATDVKLKQWDETPKFGSNANIQPRRYPLARRCLPIICQGILFITETFAQTAEWKHILLGKLPSLKPFPKVGKYQPGMDAHAFSEENQVWWVRAREGYQQQGKGLVLVQNSDSSPPQIEYIPRQLLKKTMRQYGLATEDIRATTWLR